MEKNDAMSKSDIGKILEVVRAIDKRKVTAEMVEAWHAILKDMKLEVALEALRLARRDASIEYLEPRHLWSWAKEARMNLQSQDEAEAFIASPQPTCKAHGVKILECVPCCQKLAAFADDRKLVFDKENAAKHGQIAHQYATQQIYA